MAVSKYDPGKEMRDVVNKYIERNKLKRLPNDDTLALLRQAARKEIGRHLSLCICELFGSELQSFNERFKYLTGVSGKLVLVTYGSVVAKVLNELFESIQFEVQ